MCALWARYADATQSLPGGVRGGTKTSCSYLSAMLVLKVNMSTFLYFVANATFLVHLQSLFAVSSCVCSYRSSKIVKYAALNY